MRKSCKNALRRALNCGLKGGFSFSGMGGIFGFESRLCGGGLLRARTRFGSGARRVWNEPRRGLGRAWFCDSVVPANIRAFNPRCLRACKFFAENEFWRVWRSCVRAFFARSYGADCRGRATGETAGGFCALRVCIAVFRCVCATKKRCAKGGIMGRARSFLAAGEGAYWRNWAMRFFSRLGICGFRASGFARGGRAGNAGNRLKKIARFAAKIREILKL